VTTYPNPVLDADRSGPEAVAEHLYDTGVRLDPL
jgi:hypothetical protein